MTQPYPPFDPTAATGKPFKPEDLKRRIEAAWEAVGVPRYLIDVRLVPVPPRGARIESSLWNGLPRPFPGQRAT